MWLVFCGNNLKWKLLLLIFHQSHIWQNSGSWVMLSAIKFQDSLKCNITRKEWMMKFIFGMLINIKVFYNLLLPFWVYIVRHTQSTQNDKFSYLCNIFRKMWGMKLIFCLQINTKVFNELLGITLGMSCQACPKYLK